jgi:hypothetical protein
LFSYYGTKAAIAKHYPAPIHDTIIEPFAGAAGYSCLYPDRKVILLDANPKIIAVWDWLIKASPTDVSSLPDMQPGDSLNDIEHLSDPERWLIGFCINPASTSPKITASKRTAWNRYKRRIADFVPAIKHWVARNDPWYLAPDITATWYIDPPYQKAGKYYFGYNRLCFDLLSWWCQDRPGQVLVCENAGADWLPFSYLMEQKGMTKTQTEVLWMTNNDAVPA